MGESAAHAREQLAELVARDDVFPLGEQHEWPTNGSTRSSAVLMLFGVLDQVPAERQALGVPEDLDLLLIMRSHGLRNHAGQVAFPGGGVDPTDADVIATALREANEETGLDPTGVDVLGTLPEAHIPVSNYLVTPVVGWWRLPSDVVADHSESVEVFRVPVADLLDPAARGTAVLSRGRETFRSPAFRLGQQFGGHVVWGFTGMLLSGMFEALGWGGEWPREREFEIRLDREA